MTSLPRIIDRLKVHEYNQDGLIVNDPAMGPGTPTRLLDNRSLLVQNEFSARIIHDGLSASSTLSRVFPHEVAISRGRNRLTFG